MGKLFTHIIIILLALNVKGLLAQDPQFSQFYSNSMYLAPSFAGLTENNRLYLTYRNQWPGVKTGYSTFAASVDHYFDKLISTHQYGYSKEQQALWQAVQRDLAVRHAAPVRGIRGAVAQHDVARRL